MTFDPATLRYNSDGLVPVIAQDASSHEVLMMAWMNAEAVARTLQTGRVPYWSRSRQAFWVKGAPSGHVQGLVGLRPLELDRAVDSALGQAFAGLVPDQAVVVIDRCWQIQKVLEQDMDSSSRKKVCSADHMGYALDRIIHRD